jgi:DNA-cytosine methyltransferase
MLLFGNRPDRLPYNPYMRYVELFCGVGGFRLGMDAIGGMECVLANDFNPSACKVYKARFGDVREGDVRKLDSSEVPDHDILTAGFPCQSFSTSGKSLGFADERGNLFFEVHRILKAKNPPFVLLENVKGLLTNDKGRTIRVIIEMLSELGYHCDIALLDASAFGVPQRRVRTFILGVSPDYFYMCGNPAKRHPLACLKGLYPIIHHHEPTRGNLSALHPAMRLPVPARLSNELKEGIERSPRRMFRIRDNRLGPGSIPTWRVGLLGDVSPRQEEVLEDMRKKNQAHVWELIDKKGIESCIARFTPRQLKATKAELDQLSEMGYIRKSGDKYNLINRTIVPGGLPSCYSGPRGTAPTTTASNMAQLGLIMEDGVYGMGPEEYELIQGLPAGHTDVEGIGSRERVRLVGNSVVPAVTSWMGRIIKHIAGENQSTTAG